jgi:outer membrane protein OmpA-like peptidoglycan-associated protein
MPRLPTAALFLAGMFISGRALALDVDTFAPSGSAFTGQGSVQALRPIIGDPWATYGGLTLYFADDPLTVLHASGLEEVAVDSLFGMQIGVGTNLYGRTRLDVAIPFYPHVSGGFGVESGAAMGDVRLEATTPVAHTDQVAFGLAPYLGLPSGSGAALTGAGSTRGGLVAMVGATKSKPWFWTLNLALDLAPVEDVAGLSYGSDLRLVASAGVPVAEQANVGAELTSSLNVAGGLGPYNKNPTEAQIFGQYLTGDLVFSAGLGTGLVAGIGAPDVRLFALASYSRKGIPPVYDIDLDGVSDNVDRCPKDPEDKDGYDDTDGCPDLDNDGDNIPDVNDQCPSQPEDYDRFSDEDGCPDPDNDGDHILDTEDACPGEAGNVATHGCPDRDGDGILDSKDACPDLMGPPNTQGCPDRDGDRVPDSRDKCPDLAADSRINPAYSDGCPARVFVSQEKIIITEQVFFDTSRASIKKVSYALLGEVAKVMNENKQIKLVEVQGHTDNQGNDASNLKLSQDRAESVMKHLISLGKVDPNRLQAKGYGETRPQAQNDTADGRSQNRRVEFVIAEQ